MRLLRGESLEAIARETQVRSEQLDRWRHQFLEAGRAGLRARFDVWEHRELRDVRATLGKLRTKIELLERVVGRSAGSMTRHQTEEN